MKINFRRHVVRSCVVAATTVAAASAVLALPQPANADVGCWGDYCSGMDPVATGCASDAETVAWLDLSGARLELRWSPTCKTNWARWVQYPEGIRSDLPVQLAAIQDTGYTQAVNYAIDGSSDGPSSTTSEPEGTIVTSWTPMIYSPVHAVRAVANVQCGDQGILGSAVDCALNGQVSTAAE